MARAGSASRSQICDFEGTSICGYDYNGTSLACSQRLLVENSADKVTHAHGSERLHFIMHCQEYIIDSTVFH